jgi:hypothetical protein
MSKIRRNLLVGILAICFVLGLWAKQAPYWVLLGATSLVGGSLSAGSNINLQGTANPQGTASSSSLNVIPTTLTGNPQISLAFGTGSNQFNVAIAQDRTLSASSNETLDINTGLTDILDGTPTMTHLKYIMVFIVSGGDATGLSVFEGASNGFTGYGITGTAAGPIVYPNGPGFQAGEPTVGITVSSSLANLKIVNNSSAVAVTYRIVLVGVGS